MIAPRVASHMLVGALRRRVEAEGGFAMVLAKGDESAGAILLVLNDHHGARLLLERSLDLDGKYVWRQVGAKAENDEAVQTLLDQRRRFDPDLWILELSIASIDRFVTDLAEFD